MTYETIHLCNLDEVKHFSNYANIIDINDAVLFYSQSLTPHITKSLELQFSPHKLYFFDTNNNKDYKLWVKLVDQYHRTMSWK